MSVPAQICIAVFATLAGVVAVVAGAWVFLSQRRRRAQPSGNVLFANGHEGKAVVRPRRHVDQPASLMPRSVEQSSVRAGQGKGPTKSPCRKMSRVAACSKAELAAAVALQSGWAGTA